MSDGCIREEMKRRVLVIDGAMGTEIQKLHLSPADFGGAEFEGCNEMLAITRPDVILGIHEAYLEAGADIIEANTFGCTELVLGEFGLAGRADEMIRATVALAREAALRFSTPAKPRFVAGAMGPTTRSLSIMGGITFDQLAEELYGQTLSVARAGVDFLLLETCQDTRNIKAALVAIDRVRRETGLELPLAVSITIENTGTMLAGQGVEALCVSLAHLNLLYLGLNCSTGPEFMTSHIRALSELSPFPLACVPNAGFPDENGRYSETPEVMGRVLSRFAENGWINLIGGCCGTSPEHIRHFASLAPGYSPRVPAPRQGSFLSGVEFLEVSDELRPMVVAERTNVIGSRKFKRLISDGLLDEAADIARAQARGGAVVVDVCLANPDRDEVADMEAFLPEVVKRVKLPIMIDTTNPAVVKCALKWCQGKAIINSVNLEDGRGRIDETVPLVKLFGAALVVGCIDDLPGAGMALTRERKLEVARASYRILVEEHGLRAEDLYFDTLVFPCATGDEKYLGAARETIEGIRLIKATFPGVRTALGISNISFGLPEAGREVLNSVFLHYCVEAGLDLALVNAEKLVRYASLNDAERSLADGVLFKSDEASIHAFADHFRESRVKVVARETLSLDERIAEYIVDGAREGLIEDLEEKRKEASALSIINGPLMAGMARVGKLFNENKLIVAEVLQSAETMKLAVSYLEPFLEKHEAASRGRLILATVKGDVHDIGKNLVEIILSNNGFEVIDLGIKVDSETLIRAVREHSPDLIGLSGLLVKSALMMEATAVDLRAAGILVPVIVGGAALSERFALTRIAPAYGGDVFYAKDAMNALALAQELVASGGVQSLRSVNEAARARQEEAAVKKTEGHPTSCGCSASGAQKRPPVTPVLTPPPAPDFLRHMDRPARIDGVYACANERMLLTKHLGVKGGEGKLLLEAAQEAGALKDFFHAHPPLERIWNAVVETKATYFNTPFLQPRAVYRWLRACRSGDSILLADGEGVPLGSFSFPRQPGAGGLCLADYINPAGTAPDSLAAFVVTVGEGVREEAERLKQAGSYLTCQILQALAIVAAEGYAEYLHREIRREWGFPDPAGLSSSDLFRFQYRGCRYSFGYLACPELSDQRLLFNFLAPEEIGCRLTDGDMMEPEASVSALVFHHPEATYFDVRT